jgi:hypothetical protein
MRMCLCACGGCACRKGYKGEKTRREPDVAKRDTGVTLSEEHDWHWHTGAGKPQFLTRAASAAPNPLYGNIVHICSCVRGVCTVMILAF